MQFGREVASGAMQAAAQRLAGLPQPSHSLACTRSPSQHVIVPCVTRNKQQQGRWPTARAASGGGGGSGSDAPAPPSALQQPSAMQQQPPVPAEQQQPEQRQPSRMQGRREVLLCSSALWLLLAEMSGGGLDGRTVVNSLLGAYGLPKLKATPGFRVFDDPEEPFTFQFPKAWVPRRNNRRDGLYIADYSTADKLSLEIFPAPSDDVSNADFALAAVQKLMFPASEIGGDARLELPPASKIKTEQRDIGGKVYTYIAFISDTTTRSGYQVRRKNMAVAATRSSKAGTLAYVLGCSARSDQFDAAKEQTFQTIVESFRLL